MNIENCKEVLAYFCLPHTLSVRDDTKFARMDDGSLREQKGEQHVCVSANGIEFSEKLPQKDAMHKPDAQQTFKVFTIIGSPECEYMDLHARGAHAHRAFVHEGVPVVVTELYLSSPTLARFTLERVLHL